MRCGRLMLSLALLAGCGLAQAGELEGRALSAWWGLPFAGMLLSIALMPLLVPGFWHHHFGKVSAGWSLAVMLPFALVLGVGAACQALVHTVLAEYIPFIVLLVALFMCRAASMCAAICTAARGSTPAFWLWGPCWPA